MKKLMAILLSLLMMLSLVACSGGGAPVAKSAAPVATPAAGAAAAPAPAATPAAPAASAAPMTVVIAQAADAQTLDPQEAGGTYAGNPNYNLFDSLVFYNADGVLEPLMAESWEQENELTWVFHIREGVKFHNGEPCDAAAFCYTLDRMFEKDSGRTTYSLVSITSWEARDPLTLVLKTSAPDIKLPNKLVDLMPVPPKYCEEVGKEKFGTNPVGTGAYEFVEWATNNYILLKRNENYYGKKPEIEQLKFVAIPEASTRLAELMAGNVDIILDVNSEYIDMIKSSGNADIQSVLGKRVPWVGINQLEWAKGYKYTSNKLIRQAMNYAVDVEAICSSILGGYSQPIASLWRVDHDGYDASVRPIPYDPEKAKALIAEAGYKPGEINLTMITSPGVILQGLEVGQAVAAYLEAVGITVKLESMELNTLRSVVIGAQDQKLNADLYVSNWGTKPTEITSCLNGIIVSGGITNYYHNPEVDAVVKAAAGAPTAEARDKLYAELQRTMLEECPFIWLYQQGDIYGVSHRIQWKARMDQYVLGRDMKKVA